MIVQRCLFLWATDIMKHLNSKLDVQELSLVSQFWKRSSVVSILSKMNPKFCKNLILKYSHGKFFGHFWKKWSHERYLFEINIFTETGEPSWDYCTGNKGLYPWWNNCCYWNKTHCRPKTGKSYCSYLRPKRSGNLNSNFYENPLTSTPWRRC